MIRAMTKGTKRKRAHAKPAVRCAIYTRKSSNEGLEQDFNSLDAQRRGFRMRPLALCALSHRADHSEYLLPVFRSARRNEVPTSARR